MIVFCVAGFATGDRVLSRLVALAQHHIRAGVGDAGQYIPFGLFFAAQPRPFDGIPHFAAEQLAYAGAAGPVAAGAGPVDATLLGREQQGLVGPGIEFLQYLKPGPGKPYPSDTRADDLWFWQTTLYVQDIKPVYNKLQSSGCKFVSKGIAEMKDTNGKNYRAFIVNDPDGHAMLIREDV